MAQWRILSPGNRCLGVFVESWWLSHHNNHLRLVNKYCFRNVTGQYLRSALRLPPRRKYLQLLQITLLLPADVPNLRQDPLLGTPRIENTRRLRKVQFGSRLVSLEL